MAITVIGIQEIRKDKGAVPVAQSFPIAIQGKEGIAVEGRAKPEILAPAGSVQGLRAAVAAGCDAVYIGGKLFGARAYAGNPEEDELLEAIAFCHLHGVKIYLTVNTLLKDREMKSSLHAYLQPYYEAGLDAAIVQDVGVLRYISKHFPELPIHASTQMTLTMGKGTERLERYHVTRMVPARELTLDELSVMRRDTGLELEVFVHGALCYCYSGQCLFSSMSGGRSGNRGRCAQPCRLPYSMADRKPGVGGYLLSLKELCNLPYLPELIEAGVDSFKIEGRMKRPEYAALATQMYRKYVDLYFVSGKKGYQDWQRDHQEEWQEDMRCLAEMYNRNGFTQGYLEGEYGKGKEGRETMLASLRPKHGGVCVGKVLSVGKKEVIYETTRRLSNQDVVEFRDSQQKPSYEYTIGKGIPAGSKVAARYQKGCQIRTGDMLYRTKDAALLAKIKERYIGKAEQLPVSAAFRAVPGEPAKLRLTRAGSSCEEEVSAECSGAICQKAEKQPLMEETVRKALNQTGGSPFYFERLEMDLAGGLFLPVGALKQLRRQALQQLEQQIVKSFWRKDAMIEAEEEETGQALPAGKPFVSAEVMRPEQLDAVLMAPEPALVYLHTEVMDREELLEGCMRIIHAGKAPWLAMPDIFRKATSDAFEQEAARKDGIFSMPWEGYLVRNMESLHFLLDTAGVSEESIRLDHNMYVMNREAYKFWMEQGIRRFTAPLELTAEELVELGPVLQQTELFAYGRVPLMLSAQCVQANTEGCAGSGWKKQNCSLFFQNQKGQEFEAVNYCKYCYNVIYQGEPVDIRKLAKQKQGLSFGSLRCSFTTESREETAAVLAGVSGSRTQDGHFRLGIE